MLYSLVLYVPASHSERVKDAIFTAGAGRVGRYDSCCWECSGTGQFRPLPGSRPFIGSSGETPGELEKVTEIRIECVVERERLKAVLTALVSVHPYEQPAYFCHPVFSLEDAPWIR